MSLHLHESLCSPFHLVHLSNRLTFTYARAAPFSTDPSVPCCWLSRNIRPSTYRRSRFSRAFWVSTLVECLLSYKQLLASSPFSSQPFTPQPLGIVTTHIYDILNLSVFCNYLIVCSILDTASIVYYPAQPPLPPPNLYHQSCFTLVSKCCAL